MHQENLKLRFRMDWKKYATAWRSKGKHLHRSDAAHSATMLSLHHCVRQEILEEGIILNKYNYESSDFTRLSTS